MFEWAAFVIGNKIQTSSICILRWVVLVYSDHKLYNYYLLGYFYLLNPPLFYWQVWRKLCSKAFTQHESSTPTWYSCSWFNKQDTNTAQYPTEKGGTPKGFWKGSQHGRYVMSKRVTDVDPTLGFDSCGHGQRSHPYVHLHECIILSKSELKSPYINSAFI